MDTPSTATYADYAPPVAAPPGDVPPSAGYGAYPPPPPRRRSSVWIVLLLCGVLLLGACGMCFWVFSLIPGGEDPFGGVVGGDAIALIHMNGVIAGTYADGEITPESMLDMLDAAEQDDRVKAILLRIDSPGGTVAASEEIASAVKSCTKPVVASIGDVGASGAYMVASQCDEIVAVDGSTVGSIGVILEVPSIQGLAEKLGITMVVIKAGEYKDAGNPFRSLTVTETALFQQEVDDAYNQFIDIVAEGRGMPRDKVEELATGFAWSGSKSKELGLVDTVGTYTDAVDRAAALGKIEGEPEIITFDEMPVLDVLDLLGAVSGGSARKVADELARDLQLQPVPK